MIANQIAIGLKSLAQPFKKALHTAARLQADGVQIDARSDLHPAELSATGLRQLRKMLDDLNLRVGSVAFPTRRGYANLSDLERRVEAAGAAMRMASQLDARTMTITLGDLPEAEDDAHATLRDALESLTAQGEKLGVRLAAQAPSAEPAALRQFLANFPESALGVDLSPADLLLAGKSPREFVEGLGDQVAHVYANDAVRALGGGGTETVELGRGTADVPALLGMLEEHNYRGWLTVERRHSPSPIDDCRNAVAFLRAI